MEEVNQNTKQNDTRIIFHLSLKLEDADKIRSWAIRNNTSVNKMLVDMFYELHGEELQ